MKIPRRPPNLAQISVDSAAIPRTLQLAGETEQEGKYRHWHKLRHLSPPDELTHE